MGEPRKPAAVAARRSAVSKRPDPGARIQQVAPIVPEPEVHKAFQLHTTCLTASAQMPDGYPKKIRCNPFTVGDIKTLVYAPQDEMYYETLVNVFNPLCDVDVSQLTVIDFEALILFMRVNVCGPTSAYNITCSKCGKVSPAIVNLRQFKLTSLPSTYSEPKKLETISLGLPRVYARMTYERINNVDMDRWALHIMEGNSAEEKIKLFDKQDPGVFEDMMKFSKAVADAGVDPTWPFHCRKKFDADGHESSTGEPCDFQEDLVVPFRGQFFLPEHTSGDTK